MDDVIEGGFHPKSGSSPPCGMLREPAIETGFPPLAFSFIEPAAQTQPPIRNPPQASTAACTNPAHAWQFRIAAGAEGWENRVDQPSRRRSADASEKHCAGPNGGEGIGYTIVTLLAPDYTSVRRKQTLKSKPICAMVASRNVPP